MHGEDVRGRANNGLTVLGAALHQGVSSDSEITLVVPAVGVRQMGRGTMAWPMWRAAVTDTASEAPKNAWSRARNTDPTPPDLVSHGAPGGRGDDTFKDGPRASEPEAL